MTVTNSKVFIDTNILFYANDPNTVFGGNSIVRINELHQANNALFISTQTIKEYANITLRNAVYHKLDLPSNVTIVSNNIYRFRRDFQVIHESKDVMDAWQMLLPRLTSYKDIFDFYIAATLKINQIPYILTHNVSDFTKFNDFITVLPLIV